MSLPFSKLSAKLYYLRAKALGSLRLFEEGLTDIDRAIEISPDPELTNLFNETKVELKLRAARYPLTKTRSRSYFDEIPSVSHSENEHVPGLSAAVRLVHDPKTGLSFKATKSINIGDVILIEKSQLVHVLLIDSVNIGNLCDYCLKRCKGLIPCERCSHALYCSKECRANAYEEYHRIQCNFGCFESHDIQFVVKLLVKLTENGTKLEEAIEYCEELESTKTGNNN